MTMYDVAARAERGSLLPVVVLLLFLSTGSSTIPLLSQTISLGDSMRRLNGAIRSPFTGPVRVIALCGIVAPQKDKDAPGNPIQGQTVATLLPFNGHKLFHTLSCDDDDILNRMADEVSETEKNLAIKKAEIEMGWSTWSEWSTCSRTCDGGASYQLRRCNTRDGCSGDSIHYRICSMQPCPEPSDFRAQQCIAYNKVPYQGRLYEWEPHYDSQDPCALTCRARGDNLVTQLSPKVLDGTRCRDGSLDMCINGKCQPVGCDLQLGSTKKVDACGICGGDGSTCAKPNYFWEETAETSCSATCGGGTQRVKPVCKNKKSGGEVDERYCDLSRKPASRTRECNSDRCPASWFTEDWGPCSASCDAGWQERHVFCTEARANGSRIPVEDARCPQRRRPKNKQACNTEVCPKWYEGPWSGCSVTCGQGYQTRNVICREARGHVTNICDQRTKPPSTQPCTSGLACHKPKPDDVAQYAREHAAPIVQPYPPPQAQRYTGTHIVSSEPSFVPEAWGHCSVSCGTGVRRRKVECKIFLEFSRTIAKLPDKECPGNKPPEFERCSVRPCAMNQMDSSTNSVEGAKGKTVTMTYSWKQTGFTPCSASCLGGVRESIIQCVRDHDQAVVSPYLCDLSKKPDVITQTCNDQPCPPRWNVSEFSACSKPCGSGLQTREVHCVHEVTRGGNTLVVPNSVCTQPPPRAQQFCNVFDCAPKWEPGPWTKCSKTCGTGVKQRKLQCSQVLALGQVVDKSPSHCPANRPSTSKECNTQECKNDEFPKIYFTNQTYIQSDPKRKVSLKVGGRAYIFRGTHLKVKCPVGNFNRSEIAWTKNLVPLKTTKRLKVSKNGALRIRSIQYGDNGVYTCIAGKSRANISIVVKAKQQQQPLPKWQGSRGGQNSVETPANRPITRPKPTKIPKPKPKDPVDEDDLDYNLNYPWPLKTKARPTTPHSKYTPPKPIPKPTEKDDKNSIEPETYTSYGSSKHVSDGNGGSSMLVDKGQKTLLEGYPRDTPVRKVLPHIQQLLTNLKNTLPAHSLRPFAPNSGSEYDGMEEVPSSFILGKGKAENLEFDWMISNWSACSQSCGGTGTQLRATQCVVRLHNVSRTVDHSLCVDAGLTTPESSRQCGIVECPHWESGQWSECEVSRCITWNTGIQRRNVRCRLSNGTAVDETICNEKHRPRQRRECYNDQCQAVWRTGEWKECNARCDEHGYRRRDLKCVWYGTKKTADNACRNLPRPMTNRLCKGPPCPKE